MADAMPQIIWTALPDGRADYFNQRWFEYTGLTFQQSENKGWLSMVHPDDLQNCINGWDKAVRTGEPFQVEFRLKRATQSACRWHLGRALPVRSLEGRLVRWVGTCTDIHDQKLAEEKLRQRSEEELMRTRAKLVRSNADLEQFAYLASHDLQEPLRAVAGFTQILALEYADKLDADAQEYIGHAVEGAKRMQVLINQLLHYSRLGAGREPFALVDCRKIYETAVANLKVAIEESGAVPTSSPLPQVMGDSVQLLQLFQNLLANAIKFRRGHGPQIHVWAEHKDEEWQFAVRDNGIGIDPRNFDRLFVIFQQVHHRKEYSGTGMGLALCKKIVDLHGGRIWVESKPGEGSTFFFTIPKVDPHVA
jgi:PAS domain S-box-containing protein